MTTRSRQSRYAQNCILLFISAWIAYSTTTALAPLALAVATFYLIYISLRIIRSAIEDLLLKRRLLSGLYSVITSIGFYSLWTLLTEPTLLPTLLSHLSFNLRPEVLADRARFVYSCVGLATTFVTGSLARSYYTLHQLESSSPKRGLGIILAQATRTQRVFEYLLRVALAILLIFLTHSLHKLADAPEHPPTAPFEWDSTSESLPESLTTSENDASSTQHNFWAVCTLLYVLLLLWDGVMLWANRQLRRSPQRDRNEKHLLTYGVAVHGFGLATAVAALLTLSLLSKNSDMSSVGLLILSLFGGGFLLAYLPPPRLRHDISYLWRCARQSGLLPRKRRLSIDPPIDLFSDTRG